MSNLDIKLNIKFAYDARCRDCDDNGGSHGTSLIVGKTKWNILAKWNRQAELDYVDITRIWSYTLQRIKVTVKLSVVSKSSWVEWLKTFSYFLEESQVTLSIPIPHGAPRFQAGDVLVGEVTIYSTDAWVPFKTEEVNTSKQLSVDLLRLLENQDTFADAKLRCGSTEIPVHKCILSTRSPVFDAMFKNKMKESEHGVVDIEDIEPDVLKAMLRYMYGGETDHLTNELTGDLLFAADKYQLREVKSICVEKLKKSMNVDNVVHVLLLGHLHDESLKEKAKEFICNFKNITELESTEGWKSLQKERPDLAAEVLMAVVKNLQNC